MFRIILYFAFVSVSVLAFKSNLQLLSPDGVPLSCLKDHSVIRINGHVVRNNVCDVRSTLDFQGCNKFTLMDGIRRQCTITKSVKFGNRKLHSWVGFVFGIVFRSVNLLCFDLLSLFFPLNFVFVSLNFILYNPDCFSKWSLF